MKLDRLLSALSCDMPEREVYPEITSLCYDSRKAREGSLFFCLRGASTDGHLYAQSAYGAGCRAFLAEREVALPDDAVVVLTKDTRKALSLVSAVFFDHPAEKLKLIGVTGTKGKTSVSTLLFETLKAAGMTPGLIGTTGIRFCDVYRPVVNSTPESYELHKTFSEMLSSGVRVAVMEVSSQSYLTGRVDGLEFDLGIFTNLSPDHIGRFEHPDLENYRLCKSMLFAHSAVSLLNAGDPASGYMALAAKGDVLYYSDGCDADYLALSILPGEGKNGFGTDFTCRMRDGSTRSFSIPVPGKFNVANAVAVVAACDLLGVDASVVSRTLSSARVNGRFEIVETPLTDRVFLIDYAHNELSLRSILEVLREKKPERLVCLFGSVGGRSRLRREAMGKVAAELADFCVLTSDNPDDEDPLSILSDIEKAFPDPSAYIKIPDRTEAIGYAVSHSRPGDVILFAGKGHENYQLIKGEKIPFCEREIILSQTRKLISERSGRR